MEEILATVSLGNSRSLHVAQLARQTIINAGADHMGFNGYFIFETEADAGVEQISVLAKFASLEGAFRMIDLLSQNLIDTSGSNTLSTFG